MPVTEVKPETLSNAIAGLKGLMTMPVAWVSVGLNGRLTVTSVHAPPLGCVLSTCTSACVVRKILNGVGDPVSKVWVESAYATLCIEAENSRSRIAHAPLEHCPVRSCLVCRAHVSPASVDTYTECAPKKTRREI